MSGCTVYTGLLATRTVREKWPQINAMIIASIKRSYDHALHRTNTSSAQLTVWWERRLTRTNGITLKLDTYAITVHRGLRRPWSTPARRNKT